MCLLCAKHGSAICRALQGGAIHASSPINSTFTLGISNASHIANSSATSGAGIYLEGGVTTVGPGVQIAGNSAIIGAGVFLTTPCSSCTASLTVSPAAHISNNTADAAGGGIYKDSELCSINDTEARQAMANNTAAFVGADLLTSRCMMGEVSKGRWCEQCGRDLYSLNPNKSDCDICPRNAHCFGGAVVIPRNDSWQPTPDGSQSINCSLADIAR